MDVVERVTEVARSLARAEGVELLDVSFSREGRQRVLKLTIERGNGPTTVSDCATLSRAVGNALDTANVIDHEYRLEVSTPGATRPLRTLPDFRRSVGKLVRIDLLQGRSGPLIGTLSSADEEGLAIDLREGGRRTVTLPEISSARLEVEFGPGKRRGKSRR